MFDVYCPRHGCRVILFTSNIEEIQNSEDGIVVRYVCPCGYRGTWRTGCKHEETGRAAVPSKELRCS